MPQKTKLQKTLSLKVRGKGGEGGKVKGCSSKLNFLGQIDETTIFELFSGDNEGSGGGGGGLEMVLPSPYLQRYTRVAILYRQPNRSVLLSRI